jgi:uncharacterized DUF497 family protein
VDDGGWFEWDDANEGHIWEHGIDPGEIEEALLDPDRVGADAYNVPHERRDAAIGATLAGRILYVVFTMRGEKVRPVTARDTDDGQKRRYRRR